MVKQTTSLCHGTGTNHVTLPWNRNKPCSAMEHEQTMTLGHGTGTNHVTLWFVPELEFCGSPPLEFCVSKLRTLDRSINHRVYRMPPVMPKPIIQLVYHKKVNAINYWIWIKSCKVVHDDLCSSIPYGVAIHCGVIECPLYKNSNSDIPSPKLPNGFHDFASLPDTSLGSQSQVPRSGHQPTSQGPWTQSCEFK